MKRIYLILIIILVGCIDKVRIEKEYYESGKIKSISFFHPDSIQSPYSKIAYDKNGEVQDSLFFNAKGKLTGLIYSKKEYYHKWSNYEDGLRQGNSNVTLNNGQKVIQHFYNDSLYGVEYDFDNKNILFKEVLWVRGKPIVEKNIDYPSIGDTLQNLLRAGDRLEERMEIVRDSIQIDTYYQIERESLFLLGSLRFNPKHKIVETVNNSYASVISEDTISYGNPLNVSINGYFGNLKNISWDCIVESRNNKQFHYFKPPENEKLSFQINDYSVGYNVIWGKLYIKRGSETLHTIIFYKDFYVIKP